MDYTHTLHLKQYIVNVVRPQPVPDHVLQLFQDGDNEPMPIFKIRRALLRAKQSRFQDRITAIWAFCNGVALPASPNDDEIDCIAAEAAIAYHYLHGPQRRFANAIASVCQKRGLEDLAELFWRMVGHGKVRQQRHNPAIKNARKR